MISKCNRMLIAATAVIGMSSAHALSISVSPPDTLVSGSTATVSLVMDFGTTRAVGGQFLIDLSPELSIGSFTPSVFFNTIVGGGSNFGDTGLPTGAAFQITMITPTTVCNGAACPSLITGSQVIGDLTLNVLGLPGTITLSEGDGFGGRGDSFAEDLTGADLVIDFNGGTVSAPLPATAWLYATGFGLVGFWRRRR